MSKSCTKCDTIKSISAFSKGPRYSDGLQSWCKTCKNESAKKNSDTYRFWVANNSQKVKATKDRYVENNLEKVLASKKKWSKANPKAELAKCRKYQADKLNATPKWLSKEQLKDMRKIYENCPEGYEVDHDIPLRGKQVSGLHVPWNLKYLPIKENRQKSNKLIL